MPMEQRGQKFPFSIFAPGVLPRKSVFEVPTPKYLLFGCLVAFKQKSVIDAA